MAHALESVAECRILIDHKLLEAQKDGYSYRIERRGKESVYSVSDDQHTVTTPILWVFGLGDAGQTYVFQKDGEYYQSRVSYYASIRGLDLTIGAGNAKPKGLEQAMGRLMDLDEKAKCFGCHATNSVEGKKLTLDRMVPGIQCERCHGPADAHQEAARRGDVVSTRMRRLKQLSAEETSNFCGQCHRTWEEVAGGGTMGVANVRFQPYRLANSRCYDPDDSRIACVACHNPHRALDRTRANYDARCQACHGGKPAGKICKVSRNDCVSCHMPKIELPGSHYRFTDHQIRVVRANAPYPN